MTQYDNNQSTPQQAQQTASSPTAADNPQALEQTTFADSNTGEILQTVQQILQIVQTLKEGQDSNAKAIESMAADVAQMAKAGGASGGVQALLS